MKEKRNKEKVRIKSFIFDQNKNKNVLENSKDIKINKIFKKSEFSEKKFNNFTNINQPSTSIASSMITAATSTQSINQPQPPKSEKPINLELSQKIRGNSSHKFKRNNKDIYSFQQSKNEIKNNTSQVLNLNNLVSESQHENTHKDQVK